MENTYFIVSIVLTQAATLLLLLGAHKRNIQIMQLAEKLNELVMGHNSVVSGLQSLTEALMQAREPGYTDTESLMRKLDEAESGGTQKNKG